MVVKKLRLEQFRNYLDKKFSFDEGVNVVLGKNGAGKTNLLEAIYLLSMGESFKAGKVEEMVQFGDEWGRVSANLDGSEADKLEVMVTRGEIEGKRTAKRLFKIEGVGKRRVDFAGLLSAVIFRPEDLEFVSGSPGFRRAIIDRILTQESLEYGRSLAAYDQALRRRNRVLWMLKEEGGSRYPLAFWDSLLIKHGEVLMEKRSEFVGFINNLWHRSELFSEMELIYEKNTMSEKRLKQYEKEEVLAGYTLVGPHKDDFYIKEKKKDLAVYGSRGEQRMGVLALKMGEIYFIEESKKLRPILLLDDVLSELDEEHRNEVMRVMQKRQVIVTTANEMEISRFKGAKIFRL